MYVCKPQFLQFAGSHAMHPLVDVSTLGVRLVVVKNITKIAICDLLGNNNLNRSTTNTTL